MKSKYETDLKYENFEFEPQDRQSRKQRIKPNKHKQITQQHNNETTDIGGIIQVYNFTSGEVNIIYEWSCDKHINWAGGNELSVCWSPDGTKLLFNKTGNGLESHIYIINNNGGELKQITNEPGVCDRSVSWSRQ